VKDQLPLGDPHACSNDPSCNAASPSGDPLHHALPYFIARTPVRVVLFAERTVPRKRLS
jgi:hypothetical protein